MPKISLPPFDGSYADWETFRDRFSAPIIKNPSLTDFARMHYLASSLKGRALDSVNNIAITAENFQIAWDTLTARFENKRRLLATHFSTLFGLTTVTKESASDLQALCDQVNISVASLRNLNRTSNELWNDFLVYLVTQKLDVVSRKAWNLKTSDADSPPSFDELNCFLKSRIRALEECISASSTKQSKPANSNPSRVHVTMASTSAALACPLCKANHFLSACVKFTSQNPTQRRETVKKFRRCFNCMSAAHSLSECKSKFSCRTCGNKHHTLLHVGSDSSEIPPVSSVTPSQAPSMPHIAEVPSVSALTTARDCAHVLLATA